MTPENARLVRASWATLTSSARQTDAQQIVELFYARLFTLNPSLRSLFKADLQTQSNKLLRALQHVVRGLDDLDALLPTLRALGRRHVDYGVRPAHYVEVGEALLWALEHGLGAAFTPATQAAWADAYGTLAAAMQEATATTA